MENLQRIEELQPQAVFRYFREICAIPHGSGHVEKISEYCVEFAKKHNLWYRQDELYNVVIKKPASKGYESKPAVILQGHLDMVSVKEADCPKDLLREGLDLAYADGYLYAKGTSLGADDGIAVAYALAILAADDIVHPEIEAVFTVDEEIGMFGAAAVDLSELKGRLMLNLDSEAEGIFTAGCAGGATVKCKFPLQYQAEEGTVVDLRIDGLTGGHSGVEIICQRANANELLGRVLYALHKETDYAIVCFCGGEKDNAIAKSATARILIKGAPDRIIAETEKLEAQIKAEYEVTDPQLRITADVKDCSRQDVLAEKSAKEVLTALRTLPNGIIKMSGDIEGLVQTSLNLGILTGSEGEAELSYSVRSAVKSEKDDLIDRLRCLTEYLGGICQVSGEYPAWEYRRSSPLRDVMTDVYERLYRTKPKTEIIHAGLECGIIADKLSGLDCVSFGPDIKDIHTTKERLDAASAKRTWEFILAVLEEICLRF